MMLVVGADLPKRLLPDALWELVWWTAPCDEPAVSGSKLHMLSESQGIPLAVAVSGANLHDSQVFKPLILAIPAIRSRRGPRRRRPVLLLRLNSGCRWC
ncbi:hypothetical protein [Streptomyces sp. BK340]|uniref:hypothetical protein n=1 Tax=Streptomyces sp. BK340 TaxID=2572903 RepID=UPI0011AC9ED0|nr:hypothetical protein FB157_1441 [Streptomyces sp. BK340]